MDKGVSMNGQPVGGGATMNGQPLPVAHATPTQPAAAVAPGTAPPPAASYPMQDQEKVGSKCCGCCCDFRRAVIILDTILMVLSVFSLVAIAIPASNSVSDERFAQMGIDDDQVMDVYHEMTMISQIISGCGLLSLAVPVYGAMKYNVGMVSYGVVWFIFTFIAQIVVEVVYTGKANDVGSKEFGQPFINWIVSALINALLIYPHVGLISEINSGIMSQATYPREEYSCCCGPN